MSARRASAGGFCSRTGSLVKAASLASRSAQVNLTRVSVVRAPDADGWRCSVLSMVRQPPLCALRSGAAVEPAVSTEVAGHRFEEVVRSIAIRRLVGHLRLICVAGCEPIAEPGKQARREDRLHCRPAD